MPRAKRAYPDMSAMPMSSALFLSAPAAPSDEPDPVHAIWGTTVNIAETMKLFREFLCGFKPKYRVHRDREQNLHTQVFLSRRSRSSVIRDLPPGNAPDRSDEDMINFLVYPSCMNLYAQLKKYTEEVIPTMDQVLKDLMLDLRKTKCGYGGHAGRRGNCGHHGQGIRVRPFEMKALNMCDLNPSGASRILQYMNTW